MSASGTRPFGSIRWNPTYMPAAGPPFIVSSTWVVSLPIGSFSVAEGWQVYTLSHTVQAMSRQPSTLRAIRPAAAKAARPGRAAAAAAIPAADPATATRRIVDSITAAIVERRLMPGTKLAEQKIADIF